MVVSAAGAKDAVGTSLMPMMERSSGTRRAAFRKGPDGAERHLVISGDEGGGAIPAAEGLLGRGVAGLLEAAGRDEEILLPRRQPGPRHGRADMASLEGGQPLAQIADAPMAQPLQVADGLQQPGL